MHIQNNIHCVCNYIMIYGFDILSYIFAHLLQTAPMKGEVWGWIRPKFFLLRGRPGKHSDTVWYLRRSGLHDEIAWTWSYRQRAVKGRFKNNSSEPKSGSLYCDMFSVAQHRTITHIVLLISLICEFKMSYLFCFHYCSFE